MEAILTITELLRAALAHGGVSFKLQTGMHPVICSKKGVQTFEDVRFLGVARMEGDEMYVELRKLAA